MKLKNWVVLIVLALAVPLQAASSAWEQPAQALAAQIAEMLGPGQAHLTIRNLSTLPTDEIPAIRKLLEQDLKALGVQAGGAESANQIHLTLSENQRERLWVAEVVQGNETRVAMVTVGAATTQQMQTAGGLTLRLQTMLTTSDVVLSALETAHGLVVLEPEEIVVYGYAQDQNPQLQRLLLGLKQPWTQDPRGLLLPSSKDDGFEAWLPGAHCQGSFEPGQSESRWSVNCAASDDPWPLANSAAAESARKAFYNSARNYFTGVVIPNKGADLPPFYSAALLSRLSGESLLINGIDGKVQLEENGTLRPVSGARDWGSDFAVVHSSCGAGTQMIASGSGEAASDSLRAYELPAFEVLPVSTPLAVDGVVLSLWTAPDGKSVDAVVRKALQNGQKNQYEVERVTATCN